MIRIWVAAAAIGGFFSVAAGAIAAHLAAGDRVAALLTQPWAFAPGACRSDVSLLVERSRLAGGG